MKRSELLLFILLMLGFCFVNPLFTKQKHFLVPSKNFHTFEWSVRYWNYIDSQIPDYLIIGNSRIDYGIRPNDLQQELRKIDSNVNVSALSTPGGYFPFYHLVLTQLLTSDQLPKNLIFGVSPRDFNSIEGKTYSVYDSLVASSGYNGKYKSKNTLETLVNDFVVTFFPIFKAKTEIKEFLLLERPLKKISTDSYLESLLAYKENILQLLNFDIKKITKNLDENLAPEEPQLNAVVLAEKMQTAKLFLNDISAYQKRHEPVQPFSIETSKPAEELFDYLEKNGVNIFFVTVPSIHLEEGEHYLPIYRQFIEHLNLLKTKHKNIKTIIDMNNLFDHKYRDTVYYFDGGEHANAKTAKIFAKELADKLAPYVKQN